jgi:hypothetical protein
MISADTHSQSDVIPAFLAVQIELRRSGGMFAQLTTIPRQRPGVSQ